MPDGVEVFPAVARADRVELASLSPKLYTVVLTDEGGRRLYVSCLSYLDAVPPALACRYEQLVGARATRALCLVCNAQYLASAEQVLRRLFVAVFHLGPSAPVADLLSALLRVPSPVALQRQVRFQFEGRPFALLPPDTTGLPRGGEVPLRPLLEALSPANVLLVFLAVLLERRVVLISSQLRLPTLAAEGLLQLLWPIRYQHVYVPLVPAALLDLLDAPTPFLMGLGGAAGAGLGAELAGVGTREGGGKPGGGNGSSGAGLAARVHEGLVVTDLDRDCVYNVADLRPCLEHPVATQLLACLCTLMRPVAADSGGLADEEAPVAAAAQVAKAAVAVSTTPPPPAPTSSVGRLWRRSRGGSAGSAPRGLAESRSEGASAKQLPDLWMPYVRKAAASGWGPGHDALVRRLFLRFFSSLLRGYHEHMPAAPAAMGAEVHPGAQLAGGGQACFQAQPCRFSPSAPLFRQEAFLRCHIEAHGPKARPLVAQLVQTQGFFVMLDEYSGRDPYGWYQTACTACRCELPSLVEGIGAGTGTGEDPRSEDLYTQDQGISEGADGHDVVAVGGGAEDAGSMMLIGAPAEEDTGLPARARGSVVTLSRPCPLLRGRKAPVYRTFPVLHVSDHAHEPGAASASGNGGPVWQGWQWHVLGPGARPPASSGGGGRGTADGDTRPSTGGAQRKRPPGSRRNRSLSGSISGEMAAALVAELAKPWHRVSAGGVVPGASAFLAAAGAAPADVAARTSRPSNDAAGFMTSVHSSPSLRAAARAASLNAATPSPAAGGGGTLAGAGASGGLPACGPGGGGGGGGAGGGAGCGLKGNLSARSLAHYAAEQELVRQQIGALSQLLSWGQPAACAGGGAGPASEADLPDEAEVERIRTLLCLQAGGNGAFVVGRLREEVAAGGAHPPSCTGATGSDGPAGSPTPAVAAAAGGGRYLHPAAYDVLADTLDSFVSAAVQHHEFGVLADALEVSTSLFTYNGASSKARLLHALADNPYLYTRFVWRGIFSHTLLALAVATAATGGGLTPSDKSSAATAGAETTGTGAGTACSPEEALRRQKLLLQGLQRSLCSMATWLMHLGVPEVAAWELLSGLVASAGVAELPAARDGDLPLYQVLLAARAVMSAAKADALRQHRRRMADPSCPRASTGVATTSPQHSAGKEQPASHRQSPQRQQQQQSQDANSSPACAQRTDQATPDLEGPSPSASPDPAASRAEPMTPRGAPADSSPCHQHGRSPGAVTPRGPLASPSSMSVWSLANGRQGPNGSNAVGVMSPRSTLGSVRSFATGVGAKSCNSRPYRVQYERRLAMAAISSARLSPRGGGVEQQPGQGLAELRKERPYAAAVTVAADRPIIALAAASGVVLAAPQERACHVIRCQQDGYLRPVARISLAGTGAFADMLATTADGATAVASIAQASSQQAPCGAASPASSSSLAAIVTAVLPQPCQFALLDVRAARVVREMRHAGPSGRPTALQLSPTANVMATGCTASWARLWDVRMGSARCVPATSVATRQAGVAALLLDSGRLRLYSGGRDGTAAEWDLRKPSRPVVVYGGHAGSVTAMALLPAADPTSQARSLVTAASDWTLRVWDPEAATEAATAGAGGTAWDAGRALSAWPSLAGALSISQASPTTACGGACSSRKGAEAAAGSAAPCMGPCATAGGPCARDGGGEVAGGTTRVGSAAGGQVVAGASPAASWPNLCVRPAAVLVGHGGPITSLYIDKAAGREATIYTGARDGSVAMWSPDGRCQRMLPSHSGAVRLVLPHKPRASGDWTSSGPASEQSDPWVGGLLTCGSDGAAALWGWARPSAGEPEAAGDGWEPPVLVARSDAGSTAHVVAWDAARGVLVRGDDRGVVRVWVPHASHAGE